MNLIRTVTLNRANRKADKSISLSFVTQLEQTSKEFMEIDKVLNQNGILYFKTSGELTTQEVKELEKVEIEVEGKSKSQRLRNVLYIYNKQKNKDLNFNDFYTTEMNKIIEHYKSKLDESNN